MPLACVCLVSVAELQQRYAPCMCLSCQRGGTSMKVLGKRACGPLTSGRRKSADMSCFAVVAILSASKSKTMSAELDTVSSVWDVTTQQVCGCVCMHVHAKTA